MKLRRIRVLLQFAAVCSVLSGYGLAADNAYLYIVQGIPGRDIATTLNPGLPVDVLLNGESCQPRGLAFGTSNGPLTFSPGTYEVQISQADTLAPCTNAPIIDTQVTLTSGASVSAVAAISSSGQPTLLNFNDNLSPVTPGNARFVFANAADAPALQATLTQVDGKKKFTVTADPGKQTSIGVPDGAYLVQVVVSGQTTVLAAAQIGLANQSATFAYATGEATNNVLSLISRTVQGVF
jgi:hypothetical protein